VFLIAYTQAFNIPNISILYFKNQISRTCIISACLGGYEKTTKVHPYYPDTDFIFFTDNENMENVGCWIIDNTPYYRTHRPKVDTGIYKNSINNNNHTFNLAKYYKEQFYNIPRLLEYDYIIWLDGTIQLTKPNFTEYIIKVFNERNDVIVQTMHHEQRSGILDSEAGASNFYRYTSTFWGGQPQPFQNVTHQYEYYQSQGYKNEYWKNKSIHDLSYRNNDYTHYGVWLTCLIAWDMRKPMTRKFLDAWYLENLNQTTQDQISFPYVAQKLGIDPYTYPDNNTPGYECHTESYWYIKKDHGN
jgi:hypothetical protein